MGYLDSLNITGSALTAERFRTDVILQNMANQNTTRTEDDGPYRRKQVVLRENSMSFETQLDKAVKRQMEAEYTRSRWWRAGIPLYRYTIRNIRMRMRTVML